MGNQEYDCVVGFRPGIASELAAYAVNSKKRVTWWHHGEFNMSAQQAKDYMNVCRRMDQIVVVSKGCVDFLKKQFPNFENKMVVIPNMLDIEAIQQKADEYLPFEKKDGVFDFVSVGRLSPEKHFENIICLAKSIVEMGNRDCRWFIVGDGSERTFLEKLIRENNLIKQVILVGSKSNPYPYMKNADYVVHTSYVESQCLAVLEAMSLGKICVVTESIGPKEFAIDGDNCILVEPNLKSLEKGIEKILENQLKFCNIELSAVKTAKEYAVERIMIKIQNLLNM